MMAKKQYTDIDLNGNSINKFKTNELNINTNSASNHTKEIVYYNNKYYYSDGTNWVDLTQQSSNNNTSNNTDYTNTFLLMGG